MNKTHACSGVTSKLGVGVDPRGVNAKPTYRRRIVATPSGDRSILGGGDDSDVLAPSRLDSTTPS
jgi:hypothetical protein